MKRTIPRILWIGVWIDAVAIGAIQIVTISIYPMKNLSFFSSKGMRENANAKSKLKSKSKSN